jgi:hypothetical protein
MRRRVSTAQPTLGLGEPRPVLVPPAPKGPLRHRVCGNLSVTNKSKDPSEVDWRCSRCKTKISPMHFYEEVVCPYYPFQPLRSRP